MKHAGVYTILRDWHCPTETGGVPLAGRLLKEFIKVGGRNQGSSVGMSLLVVENSILGSIQQLRGCHGPQVTLMSSPALYLGSHQVHCWWRWEKLLRSRQVLRALDRPWHLGLAGGCPSPLQVGGLHAQHLCSRHLCGHAPHMPDTPAASCTQVSPCLLLCMWAWPGWRQLLLVTRLLVVMQGLGRGLRLGLRRGRQGGAANINNGRLRRHRCVSMALRAGCLLP